MACGTRSGLKHGSPRRIHGFHRGLNGLWNPFGIETVLKYSLDNVIFRLNGLWNPFGIETNKAHTPKNKGTRAKWPVEPVRD